MSNSQQMNFHQMMKGQPADGPSADKPKKLPDSLNKMLGQMNTQERTDFGKLSNSQQLNFHQMMKGDQTVQVSEYIKNFIKIYFSGDNHPNRRDIQIAKKRWFLHLLLEKKIY
jgi:hypothetical protein